MKYKLTEVISALKKEEVRYLKLFASRHSYRNEQKKLIQLFDLLRSQKYDEYDESLSTLFFGKPNKNAYYRLKNRLLETIEQSQSLFHRDKYEEFRIYQNLQLAQIYSYKSKYRLAQKYLELAESLAIRLEDYGLLNKIYDRFIALSNNYSALNPNDFLQKKNLNHDKYIATEKPNALLASVNYQLRQTNYSGKDSTIVKRLNNIISDFEEASSLSKSNMIRFKINQCAREVLLQEKKFEALAVFLKDNYSKFKAEKMFSKRWHEEKIIMISWIVNALIKVKKFEDANAYIDELNMALYEFNQLNLEKYVWLYHQARMINLHLTNQNAAAISMLEELKKEANFKEVFNYFLLVHLNISTLNFSEGNYDEAIINLSEITLSEGYKSLPKSWQINLSIVELIYRIETEDFVYGLNKYKELRRKFKNEFVKAESQKEKLFVDILKSFLTLPDPLHNKSTKKKIELFFHKYSNLEIGSNEAVNYNLWLKSRLSKNSYYELILENFA